MEESSEKRRERLQAMRTEAASSSSPSPSLPPPFQPLSNPLLQPTLPPPPPSGDDRSPRFDFYTDPMAAFSGAKRRTGTPSYRTPPPPTNMSPPVRAHSPMSSYSSPRPPNSQSPWRTPIPFPRSPNPNPGFYRGGSPVQFPPPPNPNPSFYRGGSPGQFPPSPNPNPSFYRGGSPGQFPPSPNPNPSFYRGSPGQFPSSPNPNPNPSLHCGGSGSPNAYSNSGRGSRGRGYGGSGGRGRGGYRNEQEHFYIKAMVKDPWRKLKPIVGNILFPLGGTGSWMPRSIAGSGTKRPKLGESGGSAAGGSKSKAMSLAECLALSMEEAGNDDGVFS
ncbi:DNA-directed RNA polymerase II subunit rpb1 isoform X2 [Iris pallida]|uniref:DNA-directed RNA polymerase II subunit rpb1 isoform X2 n=1 Tax=Iris pallida TaxID=29817 RepID=A0AAX6HDA5_IRIPA|nr:DNA-directed RNA polymerase II subunit rpb1 isoform X2 [Iris pallida]